MREDSDKSRQFFGRRKRRRDELNLCRAKLKILFDNASSGVAIYEAKNNGKDFVFTDFNPAAEQIERIKKEGVIGKNVMEVFPGVKDFGLFDVFQRVWKTGTPEHHPVSTYKDDRIAGWRENYVFRLPSGQIVAVYDDVTEYKHSELAIRMSEQCFRAIADYTYSWEVWVGPAGRPLWTNPAVERVTGYTVKELMAMSDYPVPIVYEQDSERIGRAFRSALKGGTGNDVGFRIRRKDGRVIWAEISWQPIYDEKGVSLGHRQSIHDVTARKEAEDALRKSEEKYRELVETMNEGMGIADENYIFTFVNSRFGEMLGYTPEEMVGRHITDFLDEENRKLMAEQMAKRRTGEAEKFDLTWTAKDGRKIHTIASPKGIFDSQGNFRGSFGVLTDITERKQAEDALRRAEHEKEAILDSLAELVVYVDKQMTILWANRAAFESVGMKREELIGRRCYEMWGDGRAACEDCPVLNAMKTGRTHEAERSMPDGRAWFVLGSPVRSEDGSIIGAVDIALDITDRKRAEEALRKSEEKHRRLVEGSGEP